MIKRRCRHAELGAAVNCHTFRATGITAYLLNGGSLENAQALPRMNSPARRSSMTARPMRSRSMKSSGSAYDL
jgi:hypothetical protein